MRIAIPITASSNDEALRDMDKAKEVADIIELRIDYMADPNLEKLMSHCSTPKVVTPRAGDEGGKFLGPEEERIGYLEEAIALGAEYVDIELSHYRPLEKQNTKIIVSHHDFEKTPQNLDSLYERIADKKPDIVKMATRANSYNDSLRMLSLIAEAEQDIIGICMGEKGMITRVYGPAIGSYLTFASLGEGKSSAPGQLNVGELKEAWEVLRL